MFFRQIERSEIVCGYFLKNQPGPILTPCKRYALPLHFLSTRIFSVSVSAQPTLCIELNTLGMHRKRLRSTPDRSQPTRKHPKFSVGAVRGRGDVRKCFFDVFRAAGVGVGVVWTPDFEKFEKKSAFF